MLNRAYNCFECLHVIAFQSLQNNVHNCKQTKFGIFYLIKKMFFEKSLTFVGILAALKVSSAQDEDNLSQNFDGEPSTFSLEFVTSVLFIVHLVIILLFLISHCRKTENLSQLSPEIDYDKLKQL